jgi:hypothetical protein
MQVAPFFMVNWMEVRGKGINGGLSRRLKANLSLSHDTVLKRRRQTTDLTLTSAWCEPDFVRDCGEGKESTPTIRFGLVQGYIRGRALPGLEEVGVVQGTLR